MGEQRKYPRAYLAKGNGDLQQVTDFDVDIQTGRKQQHTLKVNGSGVSDGNIETTISFNFIIDEDGLERDYVRMIKAGEIEQLRAKVPGGDVYILNGKLQSLKLNSTLEDAVKGSCTFIGKLED